VVLLFIETDQPDWRVMQEIGRSRRHLAALIHSEIPQKLAADGRCLELTRQLIRRLRTGASLWALWMPHCYVWLPFLVTAVLTLPFVNALQPLGDRPQDLSAKAVGLWTAIAIIVPVSYMLILTAVYRWLDDSLFDWRVNPCLKSLELLRFRGGREALRD